MWLIHMRDVSRCYAWRDSSVWVTCLIPMFIHIGDMTHSCLALRAYPRSRCTLVAPHTCDVTHSYESNDAVISTSIWMSCLTHIYIHMSGTTHSYLSRCAHPRSRRALVTLHVTWLLHMGDMTLSHPHPSICAICPNHIQIISKSYPNHIHIQLGGMTHSNLTRCANPCSRRALLTPDMTHSYACKYVYARTYMYACIWCIYIYIHIYINMHICIHIYICVYIYMYIYMYT